MSTACQRFFDILELVDMLMLQLRHESISALKGISRLACTSRSMHMRCTPSLYRILDDYNIKDRIFMSIPALQSFARHVRHVRTVKLCLKELEIDKIGEFIGKECPNIQLLCYGRHEYGAIGSLPFRIIETLPAQQLDSLEYGGPFTNTIDPLVNLTLQRHSSTLRTVEFYGCNNVDRFPASAVFNCDNLEIFTITSYDQKGLYITLADALEYPWRCTKLLQLTLSIGGCELPLEPGRLPYHSRPTPITLSEAEEQHFMQLERLYVQIGKLTELLSLDLKMVKINGQGQAYTPSENEPTCFPAMLSLGDIWAG
ncbi:hypothetical protein BGX23_000304 [Mortierella sp. AD031]|nr:hypothetical protein BGX23_000304 [Mortierella sp. AD031]